MSRWSRIYPTASDRFVFNERHWAVVDTTPAAAATATEGEGRRRRLRLAAAVAAFLLPQLLRMT